MTGGNWVIGIIGKFNKKNKKNKIVERKKLKENYENPWKNLELRVHEVYPAC